MQNASPRPADPAPLRPLLPVTEAQARILAAIAPLEIEPVPLAQAGGRVCGQELRARLSHPPVPVSAMDGYACRSQDAPTMPARLKRIGTSRAGERFPGAIEPGSCVRIFTGAMVPEGADTIALQEDATEQDGIVEIREIARRGQHIRRAGLDFAEGDVCATPGRVFSARDIGHVASAGYAVVPVRRKPRVAILSTGDELVPPGGTPGPDQIVGSNGAALATAVSGWGGEAFDLGIAPDDRTAIGALVERARTADILVTTGGASVGEHDLVQDTLKQHGFVSDFWRIAMRPGKPLMFGMLGTMPVLGMPGNPVSALVCSLLFLRPAMRAMLGLAPAVPPFERAVLGEPMPANDRREDYVRAGWRDATSRVVGAFPVQDSSMVATFAQADVLIRRPSFAPAAPAGAEVEIIAVGGGCDLF